MTNEQTTKAIEMAKLAIKIMEERGEIYPDDVLEEHAHIRIMQILYPDGVPGIFNKMVEYKYVSYIIEKLVRFMLNKRQDNLLDLANYSFQLMAWQDMKDKPR